MRKMYCLNYVITNIDRLREYISERDPMREIEELREEVRQWRLEDLREMAEQPDASTLSVDTMRAITEMSSGDTGASSNDIPLSILDSMNGNQFQQIANVRMRKHGENQVQAEDAIVNAYVDAFENPEREELRIAEFESLLQESAEMARRDGQPRSFKPPPPPHPITAKAVAKYQEMAFKAPPGHGTSEATSSTTASITAKEPHNQT